MGHFNCHCGPPGSNSNLHSRPIAEPAPAFRILKETNVGPSILDRGNENLLFLTGRLTLPIMSQRRFLSKAFYADQRFVIRINKGMIEWPTTPLTSPEAVLSTLTGC